MAISVGGRKRPRGVAARAPQFYRQILAEVAELDASDQGSMALAFTTGQAWEELPESVQDLVTNLLEWAAAK